MSNHLLERIAAEVAERGFSKPVRIFSEIQMKCLNDRFEDYLNKNKRADSWYSAVNVVNGDNNPVETIYDAHSGGLNLSEIVENKDILDIAQCVLRGNVEIWRTTFWIKEPGARRVEWHQDTYKTEGFGSFPNINAWLAMDHARSDNCLRFVEKTHFNIIDLDVFKDDSYVEKLKCSPDLPPPPVIGDVVTVELQPGECVFFDGRCLHGSPPNRSDVRRAGLVVRFIPEGYRLKRVI